MAPTAANLTDMLSRLEDERSAGEQGPYEWGAAKAQLDLHWSKRHSSEFHGGPWAHVS